MDIEEFARQIIEEADEKGTSDIHMLPDMDSYLLYFRIGGNMVKRSILKKEDGARMIAYLKFLGNMDVAERRKPQSGAVHMEIKQRSKALRFSTITNFRYQESMVIRILNQTNQQSLTRTAFFQQEVEEIEKLVQYKSGMLIFSGPVGSGKTTTMYQLIRGSYRNSSQQVITVEDPVEIEEPLFLQTQVNVKAGITYESLLKSSLRHHPDVLIVGEIRDEETAKMAIRGALTGHLILASIHAKNTIGVIARLLELGVTMEQLRQTILGVVFQKLLPRYCAFCAGDCQAFCHHFGVHEKRAAVYELLSNQAVNRYMDALSSESEKSRDFPRSFNRLLRKAYAYGYINETSYQKYQIP